MDDPVRLQGFTVPWDDKAGQSLQEESPKIKPTAWWTWLSMILDGVHKVTCLWRQNLTWSRTSPDLLAYWDREVWEGGNWRGQPHCGWSRGLNSPLAPIQSQLKLSLNLHPGRNCSPQPVVKCCPCWILCDPHWFMFWWGSAEGRWISASWEETVIYVQQCWIWKICFTMVNSLEDLSSPAQRLIADLEYSKQATPV